jgi:hypothetical protein
MIYLVWCKEKQAGFATEDFQLAYEVRKGADTNIGWVESDNLLHLAYMFCENYSNYYDCEIIEVKND